MSRKRDLDEAMKRAREALEDEARSYRSSWRPNQRFAPAGNALTIIPAPNAPAIQGNFMPNAPAGAYAQPHQPQVVPVAFQDAPEENEGVELEGIDADEEEFPRVDIDYQQATANDREEDPYGELGDVDLSEFDDFGTGRLFGNGISGRRRMNYRRGMYY